MEIKRFELSIEIIELEGVAGKIKMGFKIFTDKKIKFLNWNLPFVQNQGMTDIFLIQRAMDIIKERVARPEGLKEFKLQKG